MYFAHMNVCLHICICTTRMPSTKGNQERVLVRSPGTRITRNCELSYGCLKLQMAVSHVFWECSLDLLQVFFTTELSPPRKTSFRVVILPFCRIALRAQWSNTLCHYVVIFYLIQTYILQITSREVGCTVHGWWCCALCRGAHTP